MNAQPDGSYQLSQDDEISLGEIWIALKSRALLIFTVTFLSAAVAAAIAFTITPIYRAEVVLTVVDDAKTGMSGLLASQLGGLASLAGAGIGGSGTRTESIGTLGSKQVAETYISTQKLLPVLFYKQWDESKGDWKSDVREKPTLWKATKFFTEEVRKVSDDKKSGLITLSVEWKDAAIAAQWANDLVEQTNKTLRDRAIRKSEANLAYLNAKLDQTSVVELRQAIFRLIESEVKNVMVAQGSEDFAFKVIDPAVTPEKKAKPKRLFMIGAGAFLGLMLAGFYAVLKGQPTLRQQA
ncbi:MAG: Wzz/FepE/Etk N-terminal domain-containing protein [Stagnimonas sp.]|nr:Wzz/FepE/Etk N-terminal domain-containing protein [Stagnimonas sp.]